MFTIKGQFVMGYQYDAVEAFRAELAPRIRVNAVAPSLTDTPLA
jgi:NAD(P)-dependent dehydrogenase (short-subunit alcohol dehydrogenase family)